MFGGMGDICRFRDREGGIIENKVNVGVFGIWLDDLFGPNVCLVFNEEGIILDEVLVDEKFFWGRCDFVGSLLEEVGYGCKGELGVKANGHIEA